MMIRKRTITTTAALLVTTAATITTLYAADTNDEAMRRSFVEPENRAEKYRQPDAYFPHRVAMPGDSVQALPMSSLADDFDVTYEWQGKSYSLE